jgi:hypothetical protein
MPLITENSYNIDFFVIDGNDTKSIIILDNSTYLDPPDKPLLEIILPGFTGYVSIPYRPNNYTILNSDSLDLTASCDYTELIDIPDGIYQIKMKICPYEELHNKKCYLKTSSFYKKFQEVLLTADLYEDTYEGSALKNSVVDVDLLMQSALASVQKCDLDNGIRLYTTANKKLNQIVNKLNCK